MGSGCGEGSQEEAAADTAPVCLPQNSSKARLRSLESLHGFVAAATKELMWLSEKEEEEVGFDWSERNSNMAAKKEAYSVRRGPSVGGQAPGWGGAPLWVAGSAQAQGHLVGAGVPSAALALPLRPLPLSGPDA